MKKVLFECSTNMRQHSEVVEFPDDATDDDIQEEFEQWVWEDVGDNYSWREEE